MAETKSWIVLDVKLKFGLLSLKCKDTREVCEEKQGGFKRDIFGKKHKQKSILVFCCWHNKSQTQWLKITRHYYPTVAEVRSSKISYILFLLEWLDPLSTNTRDIPRMLATWVIGQILVLPIWKLSGANIRSTFS